MSKSWNEQFEALASEFVDNVIYVDFKAKTVIKSKQFDVSVEEHWDEFN